MAYITKDEVAAIKKEIIKFSKDNGYKITVAGSNSSTIRVSIKSGPVDLKHFVNAPKWKINIFNKLKGMNYNQASVYMKENEPTLPYNNMAMSAGYYHEVLSGTQSRLSSNYFRGAFKKYLINLEKLIKKHGDWFDQSDSQTDYFNTAFYIDINLVDYKFNPITKPKILTDKNHTSDLFIEKMKQETKAPISYIFTATPGTYIAKNGDTWNTLKLTETVPKEDWKEFIKMLKDEDIGFYNSKAKAILTDKVTPTLPQKRRKSTAQA